MMILDICTKCYHFQNIKCHHWVKHHIIVCVCVFVCSQRCPQEAQAQSRVTSRQTAWRRTTVARRTRSGSLRSDLYLHQHYTDITLVCDKQTGDWHYLTISEITTQNAWEFDCDCDCSFSFKYAFVSLCCNRHPTGIFTKSFPSNQYSHIFNTNVQNKSITKELKVFFLSAKMADTNSHLFTHCCRMQWAIADVQFSQIPTLRVWEVTLGLWLGHAILPSAKYCLWYKIEN